jgi:hypothetical protein
MITHVLPNNAWTQRPFYSDTHLAVPSIIALAIAGQCVYRVGLVLYPFLRLPFINRRDGRAV